MFRKLETSPSSQQDFDAICEAARKSDKAAIKAILKRRSIDILHATQHHTPISFLLAHNEKSAADFLIAHFQPALNWQIYGLALTSRWAEAMAYLPAPVNYKITDQKLVFLIAGLAGGGYIDKAEKLYREVNAREMTKLKKSYFMPSARKVDELTKWQARQYSSAIFATYAHKRDLSLPKHHIFSQSSSDNFVTGGRIAGLIASNRISQALEYLEKEIAFVPRFELFACSALWLARFNAKQQSTSASQLLLFLDSIRSQSKELFLDCLLAAGKGFGIGGHVKEAGLLRQRYKDCGDAVFLSELDAAIDQGLVEGGHIKAPPHRLWNVLKWISIGAAGAAALYFSGGLAAIPYLAPYVESLGVWMIPALTPIVALVAATLWQGVSRVVNGFDEQESLSQNEVNEQEQVDLLQGRQEATLDELRQELKSNQQGFDKFKVDLDKLKQDPCMQQGPDDSSASTATPLQAVMHGSNPHVLFGSGRVSPSASGSISASNDASESTALNSPRRSFSFSPDMSD